ncbi:hypothetical protein HII31_02630 [Pseudocercospora fuligena]|uniref:Uncharacterized protein n=1 Tax=Pseudocercospora fuligena TaxID=685502 RepID=A0A8H6VPR1_9PEZI|nr:hypothetical protein HII31_02630 [Pseudocercospora fuligena]
MTNNEEHAASRAVSVTMISSNNDTASESAAVDHSESTSEYQHSGESGEIAVGSSKKPVAIDTPQDMSDETESGEGSQTVSVVEQTENNRKKRAAEENDEGKQVKRAKTGEENGSVQGGEGAGEAKKPETVEELKVKFNTKLQMHMDKNKALQEELQGVRNELEEVEEERDDWRSKATKLINKNEARSAGKKEKEKKEDARRKADRAQDKADIKEDYEEKLRVAKASEVKKYKSLLATKEKNFNTTLDKKESKLQEVTEKFKTFKDDHTVEIRALKDKLKDAQKEGGPRAIEKIKDMKAEMKEKEKEVQDQKRLQGELMTTINKLNSEVNAAKTGEQQSQNALDNTFVEVKKLERQVMQAQDEIATWKANAVHAKNNAEIREKQWRADFKQTKENYRREVDSLKQRAEACNTYQQTARDLNRRNDRNNEMHLENAQKLADTQNKLQLALIEKNRAKVSEETLRAEQQKLAEENKKLREVFAQANISPLTVLTSTTASSAPAGQSKDHSVDQNSSAIAGPPVLEKKREAAQDRTSASKSNSWSFPNGI